MRSSLLDGLQDDGIVADADTLSPRPPSLLIEQADKTYQFKVKMTCTGCSSAITRAYHPSSLSTTPSLSHLTLSPVPPLRAPGVLSRLETAGSIQSFNVDLEGQDVTVKPGAAGMGFDEVREKVAKTGKEILSGEVVEA